MGTLLIRCLTGSRLRGIHHDTSDWDIIEVWDKCKVSHQSDFTDALPGFGIEVTKWSLDLFMRTANKGGHNALDVMFAGPEFVSVDLLKDFRNSCRADPYNSYLRFNKAAETLRARGDEKGRKLAYHLMQCLEELMETGRYDPRWKGN